MPFLKKAGHDFCEKRQFTLQKHKRDLAAATANSGSDNDASAKPKEGAKRKKQGSDADQNSYIREIDELLETAILIKEMQ